MYFSKSCGLKYSEALWLRKPRGQRANHPSTHLLIICCIIFIWLHALWYHCTSPALHMLITVSLDDWRSLPVALWLPAQHAAWHPHMQTGGCGSTLPWLLNSSAHFAVAIKAPEKHRFVSQHYLATENINCKSLFCIFQWLDWKCCCSLDIAQRGEFSRSSCT